MSHCMKKCGKADGCKQVTWEEQHHKCMLYSSRSRTRPAAGHMAGVINCDSCFITDASFSTKNVVEVLEGVNNMGNCLKKCNRDYSNCHYVAYEASTKKCKILKNF